ncbi:hypothetical protein HYX00_06265 [Candidatus Woesearchaeota archaeon]|nr:hypothetical protein [Candidatus Woesearchaeota archaeon]
MRVPYLRAISTATLPLIAAAYFGCGREPTKEPTQSPKPHVSQPLELRASIGYQKHPDDPQILDKYKTGDFSFTPEEGAILYLRFFVGSNPTACCGNSFIT